MGGSDQAANAPPRQCQHRYCLPLKWSRSVAIKQIVDDRISTRRGTIPEQVCCIRTLLPWLQRKPSFWYCSAPSSVTTHLQRKRNLRRRIPVPRLPCFKDLQCS